MRRAIITLMLLGVVTLAIDSFVAKRGPQVGCGNLALGDSFVVLYLAGKLHQVEYYDSYLESFYVEAECIEGSKIQYWLMFKPGFILPRVKSAAVVIDMKHEQHLLQPLLIQSNFDPTLSDLKPRRAQWREEKAEIIEEGMPVFSNDGHHKASRYIVYNKGGSLLEDYLTVETSH